MDCRSTELGCLFQKVIKQSIKSLQQSLNVFVFFVFFLPIKTIILDWQDRQLLFIVSVEDFYFIFLLSGGSGEKKNQYLFSIWTISISR